MRLGMIVRMDQTGLGNQTKELAMMLKPDKILIIDSTPFKAYARQFPEWYKDFPVQLISSGFPTRREKEWLLRGIDALLTCETPYGYDIIAGAKQRGIRTYIQYNYEFLDHLQQPTLPKPTKFITPSSWGMEDVRNRVGIEPILLRPPVSIDKFTEARELNRNRDGKRRILHIQGIKADHDRNGTDTVLEALKYTNEDFELVIKAQYAHEDCDDPRVTFDTSNPELNQELYKEFDALIMPRRYGGLCLPMNEALASGIPVFMTDVSPNSDLLPKDWLLPAEKIGEFMTRTMLDIYSASPLDVAGVMTKMAIMPEEQLNELKDLAFSIADGNISSKVLIDKYNQVLGGE